MCSIREAVSADLVFCSVNGSAFGTLRAVSIASQQQGAHTQGQGVHCAV